MSEIQKTVMLFGDLTEIAITMRDGLVVNVWAIRGKDTPMKIVNAVGKQIMGGKPLVEILWNAAVLQELAGELMDVQLAAKKQDSKK